MSEAITFFDERLPESRWGQPASDEYSGFDVRVFRYRGLMHLEMRPAAAGGHPDSGPDRRYVAVFTEVQAAALLVGIQEAIDSSAT